MKWLAGGVVALLMLFSFWYIWIHMLYFSGQYRPSTEERQSIYPAGALGLTRADWEKGHGLRGNDVNGIVEYGYPGYRVIVGKRTTDRQEIVHRLLVRYEGARIRSIEHVIDGDDEDLLFTQIDSPYSRARSFMTEFAPTDRLLIRSYPSTTGESVDLYQSRWLARQFETQDLGLPAPWEGGEPGSFVVTHHFANDRVISFVISAGMSP